MTQYLELFLLLKHPGLLVQGREILERVRPAVEASLAGQAFELGADDLEQIGGLLIKVERLASPSLQDTIRSLRARIQDGYWDLLPSDP